MATEGNLVVRGGTVVDGTGEARFDADVRVRNGVITEVAPGLRSDSAAEIEVDASDAVVAPGFLDLHTHLDPYVFWDPACDPNPQHGVTTALIGNCSLTLFPTTDEQRHEIADLFSYVEDIPLPALLEHIPWTWDDYEGFRDAVNARGAGLNVAALVGHSPLRLVTMGDDAWKRPANESERVAMARMLNEAMTAGAWGLSTSFLDQDRMGRPVPSRVADNNEFDALLDVIGEQGRGLVEFVPNLVADAGGGIERLARRCGARKIPLTWTGFTYSDSAPERTERWLELTRRYRAEGVQFWPQLSPRTVDFRLNWDSSMMFMSMPDGWNRVVQAAGDEKRRLLSDDAWRAVAREEWNRTDKGLFPNKRLERVRIIEVMRKEHERWLGRTLADLVAERGGHPSDVLAEFALENECRPGIVAVGVANADPEGVARALLDENVLVSSSDAGAHVQMLCASGDTTLFLTRHVRDRGDFSLEQGVHELTGRQADAFGFRQRGVIKAGRAGDLVVFALDELHWDDDVFVADLPDGAARLRRPEGGYRATVVAGVPVQLHGELTGALPGRMLDTHVG
jgi:N-acyl-D-aspartate/D-glutamate deacylase